MTDDRDLIQATADKARALFLAGGLYCAESVMLAVNEGISAGLDPTVARGAAMGFGQGLGGAGCACGAVSGAVMAASLVLSGRLTPDQVRQACGQVHDRFKQRFGAVCCRVLTKPVKGQKARHFQQCADLTAQGAALAVTVILERVPDLAQGADMAGLAKRPSRLAARLRSLADWLEPK
jgi:C_GCAxxG_C_C family probable redox protein